MRVLNDVPGVLLVLEVDSKSGKFPSHVVTIVYHDEEVREVTCTCLGFMFRFRCHHTDAVKELTGKPSNTGEPIAPSA